MRSATQVEERRARDNGDGRLRTSEPSRYEHRLRHSESPVPYSSQRRKRSRSWGRHDEQRRKRLHREEKSSGRFHSSNSHQRNRSISRSPARESDHHQDDGRRHAVRLRSNSRSRSPPRRNSHRSPGPGSKQRTRPRSSYSTHSPPPRKPPSHSHSRSRSRTPPRTRKSLPSQSHSYHSENPTHAPSTALTAPAPKELPNFKPTGLLAAETNKVTLHARPGGGPKSIILKYHEPPEARLPPSSAPWILYVFKGASKDPLHTIPLHTRSCWLLGREIAVADVPVEHPSCSKQHAVFQFRHVVKKDEFGEKKGRVGLYVLDLESANGTWLNGERVEAARYVECLSGDVVRFGESEREYVLLLPPKG